MSCGTVIGELKLVKKNPWAFRRSQDGKIKHFHKSIFAWKSFVFLCGQNTIWATVKSRKQFPLSFLFSFPLYILKVKRLLLSGGVIRFTFPAPLCVFAWEPAAAWRSQPRAVGICCRLPELSGGETSLILLLCLPLFYLLTSHINCGHRLSFFF